MYGGHAPNPPYDYAAPPPEPVSSDYAHGPSPYLPQQPYPTQQPWAPPQDAAHPFNGTQPHQQAPIMSSHNDPNPADDSAEEDEMTRIRAPYERHTSRLDKMQRWPPGQPVERGRRVRRVEEEEEEGEEEQYEDEGGEEGGEAGAANIIGLGVCTVPPRRNTGQSPNPWLTEPVHPRTDFSSFSSPFKRKRQPEESPEMGRPPAVSLGQGPFPRATNNPFTHLPQRSASAPNAFHRLMIESPHRSQQHACLGLGNENQVIGFSGFAQEFPQRQTQPRTQSRLHPPREGRDFAWRAKAPGALFCFPPLSQTDSPRARIAQLRCHSLAFGGGRVSGFLPAGFPPRAGRSANSIAPPRQGPPFLEAQELWSLEEADNDYDHSSVPSSWSSPEAARSPTHHLPTFSRPPTRHDQTGFTAENPHTRLLPQPPSNPWQILPVFGDENEDEGNGDNALSISPNERRRTILGQQEFLPSFHQQVYSRLGMRGAFAPAFPPAQSNSSMPNNGVGRGRAPGADLRDRRARDRQASEQRLRYSRVHQTSFGGGEVEDYDSDESSIAQDQGSRGSQHGMGERGRVAAPRPPSSFYARPGTRPTREPVNFNYEEDEDDQDDEDDKDDEEGERLNCMLQQSARHREEQSWPAYPFGRPAQQPGHTTTSSRPRRSSSISVHTSGLSSPEPVYHVRRPRPGAQRQQRLHGFMQPRQGNRRGLASGSSAGCAAPRPSPRQSFMQRASHGIHRRGSLAHSIERGGLAPSQRSRGRGAPSMISRQPPLPNSDHWSGPPQIPRRRHAMNSVAGRYMGGELSADDAPAPLLAATASKRGRVRGCNSVRGGRERGAAHITGSNPQQPPAINHNQAPLDHKGGGRLRDTSATTAMAGLGLNTRSGNEANPLFHPHAPPGVQQTGFLDGRAIYPTANGGMMIMSDEDVPTPPKPKVLSKLEQLRAQAAAQMEAIQAQLLAAEEEALAEEAAQQAVHMEHDGVDVEGGKREVTMDDIGEVEDWDDGEVDSEFERSRKPIKMGKNKGKAKGKFRASSCMMGATEAAARAMGLEGDDELDQGGDDRDRDLEHVERVRQLRAPEMIRAANRHFCVRNEDSYDEEEDDYKDIDEYEAELMTEDEDGMDGERMAREVQRILGEQRVAEQARQLDPNIDPRLQARPSPPPTTGSSFHTNMMPLQFQHAERGLNPDDADGRMTDNDDEANRRQQENDDAIMGASNDEEYEEYDSEWEEDVTGYDDATALAALARPETNISHTYSSVDAFGIHVNPTRLALSLSLKRGFADDDPDLIQPHITNWEAPRKKARGGDGKAFVPQKRFTFFESLGEYPELIFELCKQMDPKDLLTLYCIQKDFHEVVSGHITHIVKSCARYYAAESAGVYPYEMYKTLCIRDPAMRKDPRNCGVARWVPGLKWLQMVAHRESTVRDILACLAREGHRTSKSMPLTVKKIWLIMDIATTALRISLCHNETWFTDVDCYNVQFFVIKLLLMFNEPLSQHGDDGMVRVVLGQRGLTPLCKLLKREKYLNDHDILKLCIKYSYYPAEEHKDLQMFGVNPEDIGKGHLEGWGKGRIHLFRVDEIVMRESTRRKLNLDIHLLYMMFWSHVDHETDKDIEPTYEEMYMSDEENVKRNRQMDLEKRRTDLVKEGRGIIRENYRAQKRKNKKAKHEKKQWSHKHVLAKEYAKKGYMEISVGEWDKQVEVDEERANWFMDYSHPQRSMSANDVPFYPGEKAPDAVDYFDIGDEDLPDSEVASAYEPQIYDSDGDSEASSLIDHALVSLVSPGHSASESDYNAFDEFREFDPTLQWSIDDEDHPGESLNLDFRVPGATGESGWVKDHKWAEDEPQPVVEDEWWSTSSEESRDGDEDDDDL